MAALVIRPERDALLVVGVQNDFCSGGALGVPGGEEVVAPINPLMRRASVPLLCPYVDR